jgi:phosphoribosyl 1,2-cyclic phosphate phosphodiesterase
VRIEILGSAGAAPTPRPGCTCRVCVEARERGAPYARTGPSLFVHGPELLFDTPEESRLQLERAGIGEIAGCFYSHWHPDHTMGRRLWETLNFDFRTWPPEAKRRVETPIYLPEQVARDFRSYLGLWDHFAFMAERGWVRIVELADGDVVEAGGWTVRPFRLAEDYVYAFLLERDGRRVLLAPDETNGWSPPEELRGVDVAVLPMGICEHDPLTGERRLHPEHALLRLEATFDETLGIVRELGAGRTVLSHVEEMDGLSYDDLLELERRLDGLVTFAYDGLVLDVD